MYKNTLDCPEYQTSPATVLYIDRLVSKDEYHALLHINSLPSSPRHIGIYSLPSFTDVWSCTPSFASVSALYANISKGLCTVNPAVLISVCCITIGQAVLGSICCVLSCPRVCVYDSVWPCLVPGVTTHQGITGVLCALCSVQWIVWNVQCAVCSV